MNKLSPILITITIVLTGGMALWYFIPDGDQTPQTKVFIQNNSNEQPNITVEYKSSVCPKTCKLEMGRFAQNEGRGIFFANSDQGSFTVFAEFISGTRLVSEEQLANHDEYAAIVFQENIQIKR